MGPVTHSKKARGIVLVAALMLAVILLLAGLGFMGQRSHQYHSATSLVERAKAKAYAEAGVEDLRVKFLKDRKFPDMTPGQKRFAYSENLGAGGYHVTVRRFPRTGTNSENGLFVSQVEGFSGSRTEPLSRVTLQVEVDELTRKIVTVQNSNRL